MTVRERNLFVVLGASIGVVLLAVGWYAYFWEPLQAAQRQIADLNDEIDKQRHKIIQVQQEQKRLAKYKAFSLSAASDQAESEYVTFLGPLLKKCGLTVDVLSGPPPGSIKAVPTQGKKAAHVTLTFNVIARGDLSSFVKTLEELRRAPVTHRVRSFALNPAEGAGKDSGKLKISMTIEAMVVNKAAPANPYLHDKDNRLVILETLAGLLRAPLGLAQGPWKAVRAANLAIAAKESQSARDYAAIRHRDVFVGGKPYIPPKPVEIVQREPPPPSGPEDPGFDVFDYVRLVHTSPMTNEAWLHNRIYHEPEMRIRPAKPGYQIFQIKSEDRVWTLLRAKALRVDQRELYFQVGYKVYRFPIGATLSEALRRSLSDEEVERLKLDTLFDEEFAEESEAKNRKTPPQGKTPSKSK
ncbi:MAG: type II secretion system protein M [Gemmataceae bacterium]|nr:type II secretion system protein M [Gemmataceae bacterium]